MKKINCLLLYLFLSNSLSGQGIITTSEIAEPSGGSYGPYFLDAATVFTPGIATDDIPLTISTSFNGFNFDDNATENDGFRFIPPDPCGAAGTDRIIAVVNTMIECRDKSGTLIWRDALHDFFAQWASDTPLGTYTFDPKVVWDHFENRFVVVTLEKNDVADGFDTDESHILVAVSKTATPATASSADWWYLDINSKITITNPCWADYPGFEVDEEAIYITNNMFRFNTYGSANEGVRLWIIDKGTSNGFYTGGTALWKVLDPYSAGGVAVTTQPALVFGASGPGIGIGTYLVGYSGLTNLVDEFVEVIRVNNPLPISPNSTTFTQAYVNVGDIEDDAFPTLPDAPQLGTTAVDIEVNDRRALDAVWRQDANRNDPMLWLTTTIYPDVTYDAGNAGETTAHWFRLNTSTWPPTLDDQGTIGGDDIDGAGTTVYTFFPSLAVDSNGNAYFGFAASSNLIYCGAYAAGQKWDDSPSTVRTTETVASGIGEYQRTFGGSRNRWGDYSGMALDPSTEDFWIFNQYALTPGSGSSPEDGRWGTIWGQGTITADCINGSIIYNSTTGKFNFCEDGVWIEK